jgi:hypothetical protein
MWEVGLADEDLQRMFEEAESLNARLAEEDRTKLEAYVAILLRRVGREPRGSSYRPFGTALKAFLASGRGAGRLAPST